MVRSAQDLIVLCRQEFQHNKHSIYSQFTNDVCKLQDLSHLYLNFKKFDNEFADLAPSILSNALHINIVIHDKINDVVNEINLGDQSDHSSKIHIYREMYHYSGLKPLC